MQSVEVIFKGKIIGKDFEDIIECIGDGKSSLGGGVAAAIAGITATALTRKALDAITYIHQGRIAAEEVKALDWELEDAELHFASLLDKCRDASEAVYKLTVNDVSNQGDSSCSGVSQNDNGVAAKLTTEEVYRSALGISAAIATSAARVLKVASRLAEAAPSECLANIGIATQMLYATFIGGRMKLNHYFVHAPEMDKEFIARTRDKVYELEDEVSKLVGESLDRVWKSLHPKEV